MPSSTAAAVLSAAQIEEFKREGVLILPGFVGASQLAVWRAQVWAGPGRIVALSACHQKRN
jgi:hypothetical protein